MFVSLESLINTICWICLPSTKAFLMFKESICGMFDAMMHQVRGRPCLQHGKLTFRNDCSSNPCQHNLAFIDFSPSVYFSFRTHHEMHSCPLVFCHIWYKPLPCAIKLILFVFLLLFQISLWWLECHGFIFHLYMFRECWGMFCNVIIDIDWLKNFFLLLSNLWQLSLGSF